MKSIELSRGFVTWVDDDLFDWLNQWKWCVSQERGRNYAVRNANGQHVRMHRQIMAAKKGDKVDHRNLDGLCNWRDNLRFCTVSQNGGNARLSSSNTSGFRGVHLYRTGKFEASCRRMHLGFFLTAEEAACAYDEAAQECFGEFARLNFPVEVLTNKCQ